MRILLLTALLGSCLGQIPEPYISLLKDYVTPNSGVYGNLSPTCQNASDKFGADVEAIQGILTGATVRQSSLLKLDATTLFPPPGLLSDTNAVHFAGAFSGCLSIKDEGSKVDEPDSDLDGKYCLLTLVGYETYMGAAGGGEERRGYAHEGSFLPGKEERIALAGGEKSCPAPNTGFDDGQSGLFKVAKCVPKGCSEKDVRIGALNYLYELGQLGLIPEFEAGSKDGYYADVFSCHTLDEKVEMTTGDIIMIVVVSCFVLLVALATWLDVGSTVLDLNYIPKSLLPPLQGFSAYHNIIKICSVSGGPSDGSNLSCVNGLKYISITWVVLGHTLWEYCNTSKFGAFTASATALSNVAGTLPFTAVWNGLFAVDTFFVIGGCLLAFPTLKEMDKTKGGNVGMWGMFYVHR